MSNNEDDREGLLEKEKGKQNDQKDSPDDEDDDTHCFPYYDFTRSLFRRFDSSFVIILILENFNFGLRIMVSLAS